MEELKSLPLTNTDTNQENGLEAVVQRQPAAGGRNAPVPDPDQNLNAGQDEDFGEEADSHDDDAESDEDLDEEADSYDDELGLDEDEEFEEDCEEDSNDLDQDLGLALAEDQENALAKSRADRAWRELKSAVYACAQLDNSIFAGPGHAELKTALGNFRVFKTISQSAPVFSTLFKLNLFFCAMVVFLFSFQIASSEPYLASTYHDFVAVGRLLPTVIVATVVLAILAALFWLSQRPKRLKVLPNMLVLRTDLNTAFFSELIIPWQTIERVELVQGAPLGAADAHVRVKISTALGIKHFIPLDDLLVDNSEASFINAVRTWAPWAARDLKFKRDGAVQLPDHGARLTELWLQQFGTSQARKQLGMLAPGTEIKEKTSTGDVLRYTVLGILGGGGQGNTYLASLAPARDSASVSGGDSALDSAGDFAGVSRGDPAGDSSGVSTGVSSGEPAGDSSGDSSSAGHLFGNILSGTSADSSSKALEVVLKEYILPIYRGSAVLVKLSEKLADEANLLARLDHPLVVKVWHHFVNDYRGYLVMEYVEGRSLKELVASEGPQPDSFVAHIGCQLLEVLRYMHSFDPPIVHRDLSPDNVMLSAVGEVKVVDFNVARQLESSVVSTVVGKHAYIPPEQFRGRPAPASDIYALGGTLYFLLTGQDPEPLSVSRPRVIRAGVSDEIDRIVARATGLDLADRYASAVEMLADLSRVKG